MRLIKFIKTNDLIKQYIIRIILKKLKKLFILYFRKLGIKIKILFIKIILN